VGWHSANLITKGLKVSLSSSVEEIVHWEGQEA
jgi:hypothetical protein